MNCKRNYPWYKGWQKAFRDRDFVMIGIHTPETAHERKIENVRADAVRAGLTFPILVDDAKKNWDRWGNSMWPSVYLIDKHGDIRYWWYGELAWQGAKGEQLLRQRIQELLEED